MGCVTNAVRLCVNLLSGAIKPVKNGLKQYLVRSVYLCEYPSKVLLIFLDSRTMTTTVSFCYYFGVSRAQTNKRREEALNKQHQPNKEHTTKKNKKLLRLRQVVKIKNHQNVAVAPCILAGEFWDEVGVSLCVSLCFSLCLSLGCT
mmetsp:Transcript_31341/g.48923  ORF Transcript_31341/g.48923 Transcript_31341/m.48923 type:complete len:146 (+) Transcript_31341:1818-2255(+)